MSFLPKFCWLCWCSNRLVQALLWVWLWLIIVMLSARAAQGFLRCPSWESLLIVIMNNLKTSRTCLPTSWIAALPNSLKVFCISVVQNYLKTAIGMIQFKQYFVGDLLKNVSKCIHGEEECVAQRHFACAQNLSQSHLQWLSFEGWLLVISKKYTECSLWLECSYGHCKDCAAIDGRHYMLKITCFSLSLCFLLYFFI